MRITIDIIAIVLLSLLPACGGERRAEQGSGADTMKTTTDTASGRKPKIAVTSRAFDDGASIPKEFTCDGENISPPLGWSGIPHEAKSIAILCEDPDAPKGIWTHWVVWGVGTGPSGELPRGAGANGGAAWQGLNDFGNHGYGGPCPPGGTHHYIFRIYALDAVLTPSGDGSRKELLAAMAGHILAEGELTGTYGH